MPTRRVVTLVLAALLASTALGALAVQAMSGPAPGAPPLPTTESGALAHFAAADLQAAQWREGAVLVRVHATEGPQVDGRIDPPFAWDTSGDAFVGNGAALAWTFAYATPELPGRTYWITLGGDGSLLYARELADPYSCCVQPVAAYPEESTASSDSFTYVEPAPALRPVSAEIDAPDAVAIVLDRPEFREFALDHPVFLASLDLGPGPGNHSVWAVSYRTATFFGAFAAIDATTGEVLHVGGWPHDGACCMHPIEDPVVTPVDPCCRPADFHRTFEGSVRDGERFDVGFPIDAAAWLDAARVVVTVPDAAPDATYVLQVEDASGRRLAEARGTDLLEVTLSDAPLSGTYGAYVWRQDETTLGTSPWLPLPTPETLIQVAVDVTYAPEPQPRPAAFRFLGEAWPGTQMLDLHVEGERWRPMRPTTLTLAYQPERLGDTLEIVVFDRYGNEIASARGDPLSTDGQTLVVDMPVWTSEEDACCQHVELRRDGSYLLPDTLPWTLDVEVEAWEPLTHDDVGHGTHEVHADGDHDH